MNDIVLTTVRGRRLYQLHFDAEIQVLGRLFRVPAGFMTDGASIPRWAWLTTGTPFDPFHIRAAVLHDYLYQTAAETKVTRDEADWIFKVLLLEDGVSRYQAWKMHLALRVAGWVAWGRYRRADYLRLDGRND